MIIVLEDLGMHYRGEYKKRKFRKWKVQCPTCSLIYETFNRPILIKECRTCGNKTAGKTREIHGYHKHRLMGIYLSCKQRCYNPNHKSYHRYGGKGIVMCEEWKNSFIAFKDWALANGYKDTYQLDKDTLCEQKGIEPKIYSPETCMWIPQSKNAKSNKRTSSNSKLSFEDVKEILEKTAKGFTIKELAKDYGVHRDTIRYNLKHFRLENNELKRI